ncbi:uncharacterized protein [Amphiura filiformis]|uniref:uncharacterized protein n=1 Tax=Amphiura filiformis TaxID=82378 RepID=UPI003B213B47
MRLITIVLFAYHLYFGSANEATNCTAGSDVIDRPFADLAGWIMASPDAKFHCDGILTEWRFQSQLIAYPFKAIVWRHVSGTQYSVVGINAISAGYPTDEEVVYTVPENEYISVRAGDVIGWAYPTSGIALQYTITVDGSQVLWKPDTVPPLIQDTLTDNQVVDINYGGNFRDYSIQATVSGTNCSSGWVVEDRLHVDIGDHLIVSPDSPFSCNGVLTQWLYQSKNTEAFKALVFRPMPSVGPTNHLLLGINDIPSGLADVEVVYTVPESDQIYIEAGDVIGWSYSSGMQAPPLQYTLTAAPSALVDTQIQYLYYGTPENHLHDKLKLNQIYDINTGQDYREYSIVATIGVASGLCPADWTQWGTKCCPTNWDNRGDKCYHLTSGPPSHDYQSAKAHCNSMGGRLITVLSQEEMAFVSQTYSGTFYWSCTDVSSEGFWICEGYNETTVFYDVARSAYIGYWNWAGSEPNNGNGNEDCADNAWIDWDCATTKPDVLCEQEATTVADTSTANDNLCPHNYSPWENKCYHYRSDVSVSYPDLVDYCHATGGRPLVILSQAESDHLYNTYPVDTSIWVGCRDNNPTEGYWTCEGYDSVNLHYTVGGSVVGFWPWRTGTGEPSGGNEDCVNVNIDTLLWNDVFCTGNQANLICEADLIMPTPSPPPIQSSPPTTESPPPTTKPSHTHLLEGTSKWYQVATDNSSTPTPNYCLQTPHLDTIGVDSIATCGGFCQRNPLCVSFNFGTYPTGDKYCELNEYSKDDAWDDFAAVNDCMYFEQL